MKNLRSFKEMVEGFKVDIDGEEETWTKEDLIELLDDLDEDDLAYITDMVLDITSYNDDFDWDEMEDTDWAEFDEEEDDSNLSEAELEEKMNNQAKMQARKKRRKPAFKKAMRLKKKCQKKYGKKIKQSKNAGVPYVCGTDGKLHKGMKRAQRRKLKKTRKRISKRS